MVSRLQLIVATDLEGLLRPRVGEGRNTMLKRGWCASPVYVAVHGRLGSSMVIEDDTRPQPEPWGCDVLNGQYP
jgi:hypothetical protein